MMRAMRLPAAILAGSAILAAAAPARADGYSLHILGNLRTGWTDNIESADDAPDAVPEKRADFYTQVIPGFLFTYEHPRFIQELFYEAEANLYLEHNEGRSLNHRGGWRGFYAPSPLSEMTMSATASGGVLSTFNTSGLAQNGQVVLLPSATTRYGAIEGRELLSVQMSRPVRVTQSSVARMFTASPEGSTESTTGLEVGAGAGIERAWRYNALGLNASSSYYLLGAGTDDPIHQVTGSVTGSWRRDLSLHWTTVADVGVTGLIPVDGDDQTVFGPTAGVQLGYAPEWGAAGVSVRRSIVPNLYIEANTISDLAIANCYLPLPILRDRLAQPRMTVGATVGIGRTAVYDPITGDQFSGYDVAMGDVAIDYRIKPQMTMSVRYQYARQDVENDELMAINMHGYERNTVLATFYMRWPERVAAEVPTRASLRVDRRDTTPVGEEVDPQGGRVDQQDQLGSGAGRL